MSPARTNSQLSEQLIQDSFHSYLKSSLSQAKAERLLDADLLSSAEGDLMITGAWNCRTPTAKFLTRLYQDRLSAYTSQPSDVPQTHHQYPFPVPRNQVQASPPIYLTTIVHQHSPLSSMYGPKRFQVFKLSPQNINMI